MQVIKSKDMVGEINMRGVSAVHLINETHTRVTKITMHPGDEVPAHDVPVEVFFFVIQGKGTIQIGEELAIVEAQDLVLCPMNTKMSLRADQGDTFVVLNVKTPNF
ncbi:MAG: cupin domain-containing protein [Anaerovoracaceae bacterium]|jgi:quercetin dioxygenase-like cupin family protein